MIVDLAGLAASVDAGEKAVAWASWGAFAWGAFAFFGEADRACGAVCIIGATGIWGDLWVGFGGGLFGAGFDQGGFFGCGGLFGESDLFGCGGIFGGSDLFGCGGIFGCGFLMEGFCEESVRGLAVGKAKGERVGLLFGGDTKAVCAGEAVCARAREAGDGRTGDNASMGENKHGSERKPDRGECEKRSRCWEGSLFAV